MRENILLYLEKISPLFTKTNLTNLLKSTQSHLQELLDFHFYFNNPVFLALILVLILGLSRIWGFKKSFSYCLFISLVLFLATKIIERMTIPIDGGAITYGDIIKVIAVIIITVISIYYSFLKES